jgi:type II secretory pathway pseudopilin PulG
MDLTKVGKGMPVPKMKKKQGFTLIELVVACTLLIMLSTLATTTADNFAQAVKQLNVANKVWSLKFTLAQAQLAYVNALATGAPSNWSAAVASWNSSIGANEYDNLIQTLSPYFGPGLTNITTLAGLLQAKGMYDANNSANNPTIQLNPLIQLPISSNNPPTLGTVALQGVNIFTPAVSWQGIIL